MTIQILNFSKIILFSLILMLYSDAQGQTFTDISASIVGVHSGTASWGDFDNDGDLDILLVGATQSSWVRKVYRNDNGFLVDMNPLSAEVIATAGTWGDYDNDGDLDILYTSALNSTVFRNDGGDFVDIEANLSGNSAGSVAWGDYDNDGDLDILLTGEDLFRTFITRVYRNDRGIFSDISANLPGVRSSSVDWGDFDNDGDLDILLMGFSNLPFPVSKVFRNDDGVFVDTEAALSGIINGRAEWGDYDQDGNLDILLVGSVESVIYHNNDGTFVDIEAGIEGFGQASGAWGDYDNDGDLDLILTGRTASNIVVSRIYQNNGGQFSNINSELEGVFDSMVAWGDYDNDGDLDILLTGRNSSSTPISKIYRNNTSTQNTLPEPPTGLNVSIDKNSATLNWNPSIDNETAQNGLTYNITVGSAPAAVDIASPMADLQSGLRQIQTFGNTDHNTRWIIKGLRNGTYYWSVQAIDNAFAGSAFAEEQSFVISDLPPPQNLSAIAGNELVQLKWNRSDDESVVKYRVYMDTAPSATTLIDSTNSPMDTTKMVTSLVNGTKYFFRVTAVDSTFAEGGFSTEVAAIPTLFIEIAIPFSGSTISMDWGDYDNDNDLDALIFGEIYRNDSGDFFNINAQLDRGVGVWGDYDNDDDLDVYVAGKIYENDNGNFVDIGVDLIVGAAVAWGDYDNDGDLDILITSLDKSAIFRNDHGSFVEIDVELMAVISGSVAWGDYDNDSDLDILLTGKDSLDIGHTIIYKNNDGKFDRIDTSIEQAKNSTAAWGDYDNDGDLDIVLSGEGEFTLLPKVYRNDQDGNFTDINANLVTVNGSSAAWGDYDNDGDLDIIVSGTRTFEEPISKIYNNIENEFVDSNLPLPTINSSMAWGDYDNDGDLDLLFAGLFRNDIRTVNTAPFAPSNFTSLVDGGSAVLAWTPADDSETPKAGLTYNLRIGRSPGGSQVLSAMADGSSGYRRVVRLGNTNHNTSWRIRNLPDGTYYWSVQAIDHGFFGSTFSQEQTFTVAEPAAPQILEGIPGNDRVTLVWKKNTEADVLRYRIYYDSGPNPTVLRDSTTSATETAKTIVGLANGTTYYFVITAVDSFLNESAFSNQVSVVPTSAPFIDVSASLQGITSGSANWGDYDNDGDLDLLLTGAKFIDLDPVFPPQPESRLYRNDGGRFVDTNVDIENLSLSSADWGDYDNDGDLDILIAGKTNSGTPVTKLYQNNAGDFEPISTELPGVQNGDVAWGDYDNDGDLDVLLTGAVSETENISKVFRNDGIRFEDSGAILPGVQNSSVAWGDYDNDGDLDILLAGDVDESAFIAEIYENDEGIFTSIAKLADPFGAAAVWADYDSDGDLDVIITGLIDESEIDGNLVVKTKIYENSDGTFLESNLDYDGVIGGDIASGDYDNDGHLDILLAGEDINFMPIAKILRNTGEGFVELEAQLTALAGPSVAWGDFDNDGDLDFLLTGADVDVGQFGQGVVKIYRNLSETVNTPPAAPDSLKSFVRRNTVTLNWNKSTDNETSKSALSYNLRIGTAPDDVDIVSPMADVSTGFLRVPRRGNTNLRNSRVITNLPEGIYYWSVQAIDNSFSGSAFAIEDTFSIQENTLPIVAEAIPDTFIFVGVEPFVRDMNAPPVVFTDADGDTLSFQASSSDTTIVTVQLSGNILTALPITPGNAVITIIAQDTKGGSATTTFTITVRPNLPPGIQEPPSVTQSPEGVTVSALIVEEEDVGVRSANLWFRRGGDSDFIPMQMSLVSGTTSTYQTIIRPSDVTSRGLEYFLDVEDLGGLRDRVPETGFFSIQVRVEDGVINLQPQPGGIGQDSYRLISLPLDVDRKAVRDVLQDIGEYNIKKWRFFELLPGQDYSEFPDVSDMQSGKGFLLNIKEPGFRIPTGPGQTNRTDMLFPIPLHAEWNFIGNSFDFNIPLSNLQIRVGDSLAAIDPTMIRSYDGDWNDIDNPDEIVSEIRPFEGYALYAGSTNATLLINPDLAGTNNTFSPKIRAGEEKIWSVRIIAQCQKAKDSDNHAAIYKNAHEAKDSFDKPEPPVIGKFVSLYFVRSQYTSVGEKLCVDARPMFEEGDVWEFEVRTNIRDKITLFFEGIEAVPKIFEVWLVDNKLQITQNLRDNNHYIVAGNGLDNPKRLKLVIGKREFVGDNLASIVIPKNYELSQNFPNPFNPSTTVRFGFPKSEKVTVKIYNVLGEEVITLLDDEVMKAGYHTVVWDGQNWQGQAVGSGVYFYRFSAGNFSKTMKMALVK